jgi:hypothetical protein
VTEIRATWNCAPAAPPIAAMAAPADLVGAVAEAEAVLRGHRVWDVTDVFNAARHLATAIRNSMTLTQTHPDDPVFLRALRARGVVLATLCRIQHPDRLGLCVDQASQNYGYLQKRMALTGVPDMRAHVTVLECAAYRAANDTMAYQKAVTALQVRGRRGGGGGGGDVTV